jgi:hypothetical protein
MNTPAPAFHYVLAVWGYGEAKGVANMLQRLLRINEKLKVPRLEIRAPRKELLSTSKIPKNPSFENLPVLV